MSIGFTEILLIVIFVLLVFGAKRIPELARALGRASYEFKKAKTAQLLKTPTKILTVANMVLPGSVLYLHPYLDRYAEYETRKRRIGYVERSWAV